MAGIPAIGAGPIAVTKDGAHLTIPLGALSFVNGAITVGAWPPYGDASVKAIVDPWLGYLVKQDVLKATTVAPAGPAFSLKATNVGSSGDAITVKITKVTSADPKSDTAIDAAVSVTNVYTDLTPATIAATLGNAPGAGTQPGLVYVKSIANPPTMPAAVATTALGNPPTIDVKDDTAAAATAFTLAAPGTGGGPDNFDVKIAVNAAKTAFTLTVNWKKTKAAVKLSDFNTQFGYVVTCIPPAGGFATDPAVGDITLSGGADPTTSAPTNATGVVASA